MSAKQTIVKTTTPSSSSKSKLKSIYEVRTFEDLLKILERLYLEIKSVDYNEVYIATMQP